MLIKKSKQIVSIIALCFVFSACEVKNDNNVSCNDNDCSSSCQTIGYIEGKCIDDVCMCTDENGNYYEWLSPSDTDTETETNNDAMIG